MKACIFTIADKNNEWMIPMLKNSLRKWHSESDLPLIVCGEEELSKIDDPHKFYRATPMFARELLKEYDLVIKADCDQLFFGDINHILNSEYGVGVVYNWNRVDPLIYGEVALLTIHPRQYYNCGLVAMRDKRFVDNWWNLCNSPHFYGMPMREQGFLNILCHYGDYDVKCFDDFDKMVRHNGWYGLASKSEWLKAELIDGKVIIPKAEDGYPDRDKEVHVIHFAGGNDSKKMAYRTAFSEEMISYIDWLVTDTKEPYVRKETITNLL